MPVGYVAATAYSPGCMARGPGAFSGPMTRRHAPPTMRAMSISHPRRTLVAVLLFVVVAGVVAGPLAGRLSSSGGFVAPGADSEVALARLHAATGRDAAPGIVLLTTPAARDAAAARLARIPGVAQTGTPAPRIATATLRADAADDAVVERALDAFAGRRDVVVGGPAVADVQVGDTVGADLGRAELIAFPFLIRLSLLFFRGRAALLALAVGATTVLGTFLVLSAVNLAYGLNVFALNPGHGARARPRDRLHAVLAFCFLALAAGDAVRSRREAVERTAAASEEQALRRLGEERLRIAREVHDVVAHAMVEINVQAGSRRT